MHLVTCDFSYSLHQSPGVKRFIYICNLSFTNLHLTFTIQVVGVNVDAGARYTFGGTEDPAGVVNIYSAGSLAADKNNSSAKVISEHLQKHFNIPSGR